MGNSHRSSFDHAVLGWERSALCRTQHQLRVSAVARLPTSSASVTDSSITGPEPISYGHRLPTLQVAAPGAGTAIKDLLELRVVKTLIDAGIKLESVREVFAYLRTHVSADIASAHLVISGQTVVLAQGDELIDVVKQGQGVLNVLSLAGVKNDIARNSFRCV